jgi:dTDP-4-amino-4,6-dideoxygalactose transaminase
MIPYLDLKKQYRNIKPEIDQAIQSVLSSGQFVLGPEVQAFEESFAEFCQTRFSIGVNSGTSAIHLALLAAGVGPGDEVITVSFTFVATVAAILYAGATPVFVDVNPTTFTLDPARIERAITRRTKAIIPVHLYGQPADMNPILKIARKRGLIVIEDAAQAHGAEYKGHRVGSLGDMGCFSFYPGKNIGAYGEAGAVTTNSSKFLKSIRRLRDWGAEKKYHHDVKGFNYRMEALQGAVLKVKLSHLERWNKARRTIADTYDEAFQNSNVQIPVVENFSHHVYHIYAIRTAQRKDLIQYLNRKKVQTNIHYPIPVHLQRGYADLGYKIGDLPVTESLCRQVLSLPIFPEMTKKEINGVVQNILGWKKAI